MSTESNVQMVIELLCEGQNLSSESRAMLKAKEEKYPNMMKINPYFDFFVDNKETTDWKKFFDNVEKIMTSGSEEQSTGVCYYVLESLPPLDPKPGTPTIDFFKPFMGPKSWEFYVAYNGHMDKVAIFTQNRVAEMFPNPKSKK